MSIEMGSLRRKIRIKRMDNHVLNQSQVDGMIIFFLNNDFIIKQIRLQSRAYPHDSVEF